MATDPIVVNIIFGGQTSKVTLASCNCNVAELMTAIQKLIRIPPNKQRLIFKGKSLLDPELSLSSCGIKTNSKIMVLGSVEQLEPHEAQKLMKAKEEFERLASEIDQLCEKTKLICTTDKAEVSAYLKTTIVLLERCMQCLELLDSVRLPYDCETERSQRKQLVDFIQDLIVKADGVKATLMQASLTE
ncbi:Bcl2-associated athanogene 1 [Paragonimus heterotremus]|uniref:BAG family molecular chaperone regulator 1 n=1 Tax=Paragonimus heterotremus TaxID=100268 RepID=A0A8J4TDB5_9TREM|nr:Bcl2-associated athanogene 1 [Paragonimus heterotremus]